MVDSGSTVSLMDHKVLDSFPETMSKSAKQSLVTASGNVIESLGEVDLPMTVGKLHCFQKFVVVSSLIESCILGVDFLVKHRVNLDFNARTARA